MISGLDGIFEPEHGCRLILELKGKLRRIDAQTPADAQVLATLQSLGYSIAEQPQP